MEHSATNQSDRATKAPPPAYERSQGNGPLGGHPQRQQVIDAILEGQPATSIKAWVNPPVSHVSICKLAKIVKQQVSVARVVEKVARIEAFAGNSAASGMDTKELTKAAVLGGEHLARIQAHQLRIDKRLETLPGDCDVNDLSTLVKTDLQGIRLAAELDGSLANANPVQHNTFQVVVLPGQDGVTRAEQPAIEATFDPAE